MKKHIVILLSAVSKQKLLIAAEKTKLKNSAFCICLNKVYPGYNEKLNDGSAAGYFETSAYNIEAFEKLDSLVKVFISINYRSKYERNLGIQKCLDFYNSQDLSILINKLDVDLDRKKLENK